MVVSHTNHSPYKLDLSCLVIPYINFQLTLRDDVNSTNGKLQKYSLYI